MADNRTTVTELATALGMLGLPDVASALTARSPVLVNVEPDQWDLLADLYSRREFSDEFDAAFENGSLFAMHSDGLGGRQPRRIEWKGAHRAPGDEVVPVDLRVDNVYLISCKYLSQNLHNAAPARVFRHLLLTVDAHDRTDWYLTTAHREYQDFYVAATGLAGLTDLPQNVSDLTVGDRLRLKAALSEFSGQRLPEPVHEEYRRMIEAVSNESARLWDIELSSAARRERMLWRLLRIGSTPYFILGADRTHPLRLRIDTAWDWRQRYKLKQFRVEAAAAGQPQVNWSAIYTTRGTRQSWSVAGRVEIRWGHGRFAQPPEAKIYLDTPHDAVPGYNALP